jgi:hypothetical protein
MLTSSTIPFQVAMNSMSQLAQHQAGSKHKAQSMSAAFSDSDMDPRDATDGTDDLDSSLPALDQSPVTSASMSPPMLQASTSAASIWSGSRSERSSLLSSPSSSWSLGSSQSARLVDLAHDATVKGTCVCVCVCVSVCVCVCV